MKSKEGFMHSKLEKRTCAVCGGIYYVKKYGKKAVLMHNLNVRPRNSYTCSKKCSMIYRRVFDKIKSINKRKKK